MAAVVVAAAAAVVAVAAAAKVVARGNLLHRAMVATVNLHRPATAKVSRLRRDPTATKADLHHRRKTNLRDNLRNRANPRRPAAARASRLRKAPTAAKADLHHRRKTNRRNRANRHHPVTGSSRLPRETMVGKGSHRPPLEQANLNSRLRANSARSPRLLRRARANCRPTRSRKPAGQAPPPTGKLTTQLVLRAPQAR
jgi:hypothetical protein